ncbi:unnamed protein product [Phaedon cochleariae]|uniref:Gamma-interferon-inducible lysosomal thiol reductase n=1 Tax=Phaedon cochleariae TaxID=80249 RepID=A0A9N9SKC4_PHACE|nr:unnamed protein product [Phaedon cochleariae]
MIFNFVYFFLAQILLSTASAQIKRVNVTVYYETLCPFAKAFIVKQLHPVLEGNLSNYINLNMIPYGKAVTTQYSNGTFTFECHHKAVECYGNKIQACALTIINSGKNTENLGYNKDTIDFIACLMNDLTPQSTREEVDTSVGSCIDAETAPLLKSCASMPFGEQYLAYLGILTRRFQRPLGNVPTIVYNEKFSKTESDSSEKDFQKTLCSKLGKNTGACSGSSISHTINNLLFVMGLLVSGFRIATHT